MSLSRAARRAAVVLVGIATLSFAVLSVARLAGADKAIRIPMRADGPRSLDPVQGSSQYDNRCASMVYEPLLEYEYLVRPFELRPLLLAEMPRRSADGLTYSFRLRDDVRFHDDPCFPGGKGRRVVTSDVFYSWKRMADASLGPKSWWLFESTIAGFDEFRAEQAKADRFDYDAPVAGMREKSELEFDVVLARPVYRFPWVLAMFQTAVVPREAVELYGARFGRHPVGTGPFILQEEDWQPLQGMVFRRNPAYRDVSYPTRHQPEDEPLGLHAAAGKRIPFLDRVELRFFVRDQPMWLQFRAGKLDYVQVPAENFREVFSKRRGEIRLRKTFRDEGIVSHAVPLLEYVFRAFNMEDDLVGGYSDKARALRQAISLALDWEEQNATYYNGRCVVYDGMIPPGIAGHPTNGRAPVSFRGPDLERARELLARAGYPGGRGLPPIDYYAGNSSSSAAQAEMVQRQLEKIGVRLRPRHLDFAALMEAIGKRQAAFFTFSWGLDYPDAENTLALFYGPNRSPGSNHSNYRNPAFDAMYEKLVVLPPSAERDRLVEKMRDTVLADAPFCGSFARTRFYLVSPRLKNLKPNETFHSWVKYLDVVE